MLISLSLIVLFLPNSYAFQATIFTFSSLSTKTSLTIGISFTMEWVLAPTEILNISMPYFTRSTGANANIPGSSLSWGSVRISPSTVFQASWHEGSFWDPTPFSTSTFMLKLLPNVAVTTKYYPINVTIFEDNGIKAFCGFPDSTTVANNAVGITNIFFVSSSLYPGYSVPVGFYKQMGNGCTAQQNCHNNGACDFCYEKCMCFDGYGSSGDISTTGTYVDATCRLKVNIIIMNQYFF